MPGLASKWFADAGFEVVVQELHTALGWQPSLADDRVADSAGDGFELLCKGFLLSLGLNPFGQVSSNSTLFTQRLTSARIIFMAVHDRLNCQNNHCDRDCRPSKDRSHVEDDT